MSSVGSNTGFCLPEDRVERVKLSIRQNWQRRPTSQVAGQAVPLQPFVKRRRPVSEPVFEFACLGENRNRIVGERRIELFEACPQFGAVGTQEWVELLFVADQI